MKSTGGEPSAEIASRYKHMDRRTASTVWNNLSICAGGGSTANGELRRFLSGKSYRICKIRLLECNHKHHILF